MPTTCPAISHRASSQLQFGASPHVGQSTIPSKACCAIIGPQDHVAKSVSRPGEGLEASSMHADDTFLLEQPVDVSVPAFLVTVPDDVGFDIIDGVYGGPRGTLPATKIDHPTQGPVVLAGQKVYTPLDLLGTCGAVVADSTSTITLPAPDNLAIELTPTLMRLALATTNGKGCIEIPNVSFETYMTWVDLHPELDLELGSDDLRYEYVPGSGKEVSRLIIKCMPTPYHDAVSSTITSEVQTQLTNIFCVNPIKLGIKVSNSGGMCSFSMLWKRSDKTLEFHGFESERYGDLKRSAKKTPDAAITVGCFFLFI